MVIYTLRTSFDIVKGIGNPVNVSEERITVNICKERLLEA